MKSPSTKGRAKTQRAAAKQLRSVAPRSKSASLPKEDDMARFARSGAMAKVFREAVRAQRDAGLAITYQSGNKIVKEFPDGRRQTIGTLKLKSSVTPKGVARISNS